MSKHNTVIFAAFDALPFTDAEGSAISLEAVDLPYINVDPSTISFSISAKDETFENQTLNFSSNGIIGLTKPLSSFTLPKVNFANQSIYFTTKVLDISGNPLKNLPKIQPLEEPLITHTPGVVERIVIHNTDDNFIIADQSELVVSLVQPDDTPVPGSMFTFDTNFGNLSGDDAGGYLKGVLSTSFVGNDLRIKVLFQSGNVTITGFSTTFDVYPADGVYDVRKVGEDNNQTQNYKDLSTQPVMQRNPLFMDELLGQIVGNNNSDPNTLGIKIEEKINNYVSNINDPDYANLKSLNSLVKELSITFDEYNQEFPPSLSRLIDILSVSVSKQLGGRNQFQGNFDSKGYTTKEFFGKNRGDKLPIESTILRTGAESKNILAYEKFSNQYKLVNTNILSATNIEYSNDGIYPLSSYNNTWGWGLLIPVDVFGNDISDYYEFYDFNDTIEGTYLQKFIDFDNVNNTYLTTLTSYSQYTEKWGIVENIISHNLYTNLGLISGS